MVVNRKFVLCEHQCLKRINLKETVWFLLIWGCLQFQSSLLQRASSCSDDVHNGVQRHEVGSGFTDADRDDPIPFGSVINLKYQDVGCQCWTKGNMRRAVESNFFAMFTCLRFSGRIRFWWRVQFFWASGCCCCTVLLVCLARWAGITRWLVVSTSNGMVVGSHRSDQRLEFLGFPFS